MPSTEVWLSAIYAVYPSNAEQIKTELANLYRMSNPDIGFLTGYAHRGQSDLLLQVSPFADHQYKGILQEIEPKFSDYLPLVTE